MQIATGQYITPTGLRGAVQQYLNPGLPAYPDFVAGEAVRSQLSPDGTTLAIICAGQNSLYKPDGTVDMAHSTQFIFLYNVAGGNKAKPVLTQVIQQVNAHVGLVFSPDGSTLYAAGGNDDAVYVYTKSGSGFLGRIARARSPLGHARQGRRPQRAAQRQRHGHLRRRRDAGRRQQLQRLDQRDRHRHARRPLRARPASVLRRTTRARNGGAGGTFPFAVVVKGNGTAYVSSDRDREVVVVDVVLPDRGPSDQAHQARRQRARDDARRSQSRLYRGAGQRRPGRGHRHVRPTGSSPRSTRGPRPACCPARDEDTAGAAHVRGDASRRDGNTLYAVNSGANSIAVIPLRGENAHTRSAA